MCSAFSHLFSSRSVESLSSHVTPYCLLQLFFTALDICLSLYCRCYFSCSHSCRSERVYSIGWADFVQHIVFISFSPRQMTKRTRYTILKCRSCVHDRTKHVNAFQVLMILFTLFLFFLSTVLLPLLRPQRGC